MVSAQDGEKLVLGYWKIRGLAAPARMMLMYANVDYEDVAYAPSQKEDGSWDMSCWFADAKEGLKKKNALINMPYIEDQGKVVTQSNAVLLYIGRKTGLNGKTDDEVCKNEQVMFQCTDLRNSVVELAYPPRDQDKLDAHFEKNLTTHYGKFENWLVAHSGSAFLSADRPLSADFHVFEMIDQHELWAAHEGKKSPLDTYPNLASYYKRFQGLENMKSYFASDVSKYSINAPMAQTFSGPN